MHPGLEVKGLNIGHRKAIARKNAVNFVNVGDYKAIDGVFSNTVTDPADVSLV